MPRVSCAVRVIGALALYLATVHAVGQDLGPVQTRNHRALSLPFLRIEPSFGVLERGRRSWSLGYTNANDIRREPRSGAATVEEDQETSRVAFRYREGIGDATEWWVDVPFLSRGGGFLDPIIDGWHQNVLGWSDQLRNTTPFGRSVVSVAGSG